MTKKIFITAPAAQAREIAELLRVASQIPQTKVEAWLGFDSLAQAGQYQRRIKEALLEARVDPETFTFTREKDSLALEISCVGPFDTAAEDEPEPAPPVPDQPTTPHPPVSNGSLPFDEGKAVLESLRVIDKSGGSYVVSSLRITEGPGKEESFTETIRRFPPHGRLQRFADAFGVSADDLVVKSASLIGTPVWFRRRTTAHFDGTPRMETYYYRISSSPLQLVATR